MSSPDMNSGGIHLQSIANGLESVYETTQASRVSNLPGVRKQVRKNPAKPKVLRTILHLGSVGSKKPQSKTPWLWDLMAILENSTALPAFSFGSERFCTYCGDPPIERDHVIPVSYQHAHSKGRISTNGPLTWACRDCNKALHNRYFDSFINRCIFARWRIERKVKPMVWSGAEMAHLDYVIRTYVKSESRKRAWLRNRADWYESREFLLNIESLSWEMARLRPTSIGNTFILSYFSSTVKMIAEIYQNRV